MNGQRPVGRRRIRLLIAVTLSLAAWTVGTYATVWFVDVGATAGANTGASWADAYTDLQTALTAAENGDEIWVAEGTYMPSSPAGRDATFLLENGVALYGGFDGTETLRSKRDWTSHEAILSGDIGTVSVDTDNAFTVVTSSSNNATAILDGFTIMAGNADQAVGGDPTGCGGGMYNSSSSPTVTHCDFDDNYADVSGGGMYNYASSPTVTDCTFRDNSTQWTGGGGMYNNYTSSPTLTDCTFDNNSSLSGGGVYNTGGSSPPVSRCTFSGNSANSGGGMYNGFGCTPEITNCTFSDNTATDTGLGGGLYAAPTASSTITYCTFSGNTAVNKGGGLYLHDASPTLGATIVANNSAPNGPDIYCVLHTVVTSAGYNLVESGDDWSGSVASDLIGSDPQLDALADNGGSTQTHAVQASSDAINAVPNGTFPSVTLDQCGTPRPQGPACDIGAYEYPFPEIDVSGLGRSIADGDTTPSTTDDTDFGTAVVGGAVNPNTFTITNTGPRDLTLSTAPRISVQDGHTDDFVLSADADATVAAVSGTTTFTITFEPIAPGLREATVSIANDDPDENPYTFSIQGFATSAAVFRIDRDGQLFADGAFYGTEFQSGSADVAEWVHMSTPAKPGDVIEFDPLAPMQYHVTQDACSSLVAGVISTTPGVTLGADLDASEKALLALIGIVPVKVTNEGGPIQPGDLLVTSSTPGHAMRWSGPDPCFCSLVGKALEPMDEEQGVILVLLTAH